MMGFLSGEFKWHSHTVIELLYDALGQILQSILDVQVLQGRGLVKETNSLTDGPLLRLLCVNLTKVQQITFVADNDFSIVLTVHVLDH